MAYWNSFSDADYLISRCKSKVPILSFPLPANAFSLEGQCLSQWSLNILASEPHRIPSTMSGA